MDTANNISEDFARYIYIIDTKARTPKNLELTSNKYGVYLTWQCQEKNVKRYEIYRRLVIGTQAGAWQRIYIEQNGWKDYLDQTAVPWKKYDYRVKVIDSLNNSNNSEIYSIKYRK